MQGSLKVSQNTGVTAVLQDIRDGVRTQQLGRSHQSSSRDTMIGAKIDVGRASTSDFHQNSREPKKFQTIDRLRKDTSEDDRVVTTELVN